MNEYKYNAKGTYMGRALCRNCKKPIEAWHRVGKPPKLVIAREKICPKCNQPSGHNIVVR